ncbi:MAG: hypothetical protein ABUS51_09295 [Acidobacteriota bacterium]
MKNAFVRFGQTCVSVVIGSGLIAGALLAGEVNRVIVTLPHAVTVGSVTLPVGEYTLTSMDMSDGDQYFIVRGDHTPTVTLQTQKIDAPVDGSKKTEVVFTQDGAAWHFEKLFVQGDTTGYQFTNAK